MCPVAAHLRSKPEVFQVSICVTAQYRQLLDQVLDVFGVRPDYDLNTMYPGQSPLQATARMLERLEGVVRAAKPDLVLVQPFSSAERFSLRCISSEVEDIASAPSAHRPKMPRRSAARVRPDSCPHGAAAARPAAPSRTLYTRQTAHIP